MLLISVSRLQPAVCGGRSQQLAAAHGARRQHGMRLMLRDQTGKQRGAGLKAKTVQRGVLTDQRLIGAQRAQVCGDGRCVFAEDQRDERDLELAGESATRAQRFLT